ncbi:putative N-acetyltransferase HLS1 [Vitis vinifera]|uniref:Putative N-acetyltransferase HLS1 n=1 Tax=Vitis vinifera TaxID=29760 RepID=A0A438G1V1_VITVI|nr:putative N-acetyltransferase HLS1 [Vitis vinifera]
MYGVHREGPLSGKMVRTLCNYVHNMARKTKDCKVIVTEVGGCDTLRLHIPHWKLLSCPEDLWCIKALKNEERNGLHELTITPPSRALFVDPREVPPSVSLFVTCSCALVISTNQAGQWSSFVSSPQMGKLANPNHKEGHYIFQEFPVLNRKFYCEVGHGHGHGSDANKCSVSKRPTMLILMWAMVEEARDMLGQDLGLADYESDFGSLPRPVIF